MLGERTVVYRAPRSLRCAAIGSPHTADRLAQRRELPSASQHDIDAWFRRVLHDDGLPIAHRLVAVLVLLCGQPLNKIE
jgi:hypothetical protein